MKKLLAGLIASATLFAGASVQAVDGVTARQLLIGQSITLEGGKNDYGTAVLAGMQTYLSAVNARGGVNGRQVVLKTLDDDNKSAKAETNARQLVEKDKVFALFGSIEGGPSVAVMKAANELKVPFFGPMAGSPTLRRPYQPLVFPVRAEHREEFFALISHARSLGMRKVAFLRSDSETGEQHLANVRLICQRLGMTLVADLPFKSDITDAQLGAMVTQLEQAGAQMVFNHGGVGIYEKLIRKARDKAMQTAFYAVNSASAQLVKRLGELSHGMVFTQVVPSPWERKSAITREYQTEFARFMPGQEFSYGSLEGYVTAKALVAALRLAGTSPSREGFVTALEGATLDLNGLRASYDSSNHQGLAFVDISMVTRESKFRH
ncbi:ABC transporter substrate-binding protein [Polaromonas naphthalenivorans]|uniref:Amino acid/amide ABC transporter substrate-binding protein, HAAT family n=1 Tax=Polaromonas naphthalenivorans (strain CJ2) TaxID=365044 RepID=A1VIZ4_POLNA|nr:ABC transporter substrate-binding protein [Polaromonas naphthalenivorans]ABM35622.1 amino acid/amide ABC transporter substrate-binding protein, HAAT family [Polaromonas naphthalenivorans CJ2]